MAAIARNAMAYLNMIRPHTAYEETSLYPQIRATLSDRDYEQLRRDLADAARTRLGPQGFSSLLQRVRELERSVGVTSLAQFTPRVGGAPVARGNRPR